MPQGVGVQVSPRAHGAYGVIVAQELVELLDSEHNRIGTPNERIKIISRTSVF